MKPTLNLGCGPDTWGDVRIDVHNWTGNATLVMDFDTTPIPFPDKHFSLCLVNHVLEHSRNPQVLLNEAIRVSDEVHAKYPYKYDRIPFVLKGLVNANVRLVYLQCRAQMRDRATRMGLSKNGSPDVHFWTVGPFGRERVNSFDLFPMKEWIKSPSEPHSPASKAIKRVLGKLLRYLPSLQLGCEWECWYP